MSAEQSLAKNEILFVCLNRYAGVTIRTPGKKLVIDPVDIKPQDFRDIDAILISHEHYDHLDQPLIAKLHELTQCMVVADQTSIKRLQNLIPSEKLEAVQSGSEITLGEISIRAEKCNHPPAATPVSFVITSEGGVKVFHTADSLPFQEMVTIGEREELDLVFCTVGIAPGTSLETGLEIARLTKAKVAVPYHTGSKADQTKFCEVMKKEMPNTTCLIPEVGKLYKVSKVELK